MSYSPNLPISSGWKSTLNLAFQTLRRIKFIIETDFSLGDFDPQVNWNGMAATGVNIRRARYLKINKFLWFSVDITATLAAPFVANVTISLPNTLAGDSASYQSGAASGNAAGVAVALAWQAQGTTNNINIYRYDFANYAAGTFRGILNGFIEVI